VLAGLSALAACDASPRVGRSAPSLPVTGSDVWSPPGELDEAVFPTGLRCTDPRSDRLTLAGIGPDAVLVGVRAAEGRWEPLPDVPIASTDGFLRAEVTGLQPDTDHAFVLVTKDGQRRSEVGRYRTAPEGERIVRVGASTCFGRTNPELPSLGVAAGDDLDAFLVGGDAIYTQATTLDGYRAAWRELLDRPHFRTLAAATPLVPIWDDHEVADDWVGGGPSVDVARQAFVEALGISPTWRSLRFGSTLDVLLLDVRSERSEGRIVSDEQLAWAIDALIGSPCRFKVVLTSVHITDHGTRLSFPDDDSDVRERWQGYPEQRDALLDAAEAAGGVVFVTGDLHYGGVQRVGRGDLWEIAAGPAGSEWWDLSAWLAQIGADADPYTFLAQGWSYARITADPASGLSATVVGDDGDTLFDQLLVP
jgi:alkaline phosphatase D